jgi:hypothetical protein
MRLISIALMVLMITASCRKKDSEAPLRYFEVGMKTDPVDWRDSSFVAATNNPQLLIQIEAELNKPLAQRKIIAGPLLAGSGGYNKNAGHTFNWRLDESKWTLTDVTAEIMDGRPYSDVELNLAYFKDTVKGYGSWGSYIKKELTTGN